MDNFATFCMSKPALYDVQYWTLTHKAYNLVVNECGPYLLPQPVDSSHNDYIYLV